MKNRVFRRPIAIFLAIAVMMGMTVLGSQAVLGAKGPNAGKYPVESGNTETALSTSSQELLYTNKTAQLLDWDERTYQLELSAWAGGQSSTVTTPKPADVVLVIDRSGSMWFAGGSIVTTAEDLSKLDTSKTYAATEEYYDWPWGWQTQEVYLKYVNNAWRYSSYGQSGPTFSNRSPRVSDNENIGDIYKTRMTILKEAAEEFINNLPEGSSIAVTSYSSNGNSSVDYTRKVIEGTADEQKAVRDGAIAAVNGLDPRGGTYLSGGLNQAATQLSSDHENNVVIVFTDGENQDRESTVVGIADNIKEYARIFTIGMGEADDTFLGKICSPTTPEDPTDYNRPCENMDELAQSLLKILTEAISSGGFSGATVTDVIDPRFVVTDQQGNPLADGATIGNDGVLQVVNGVQTIVWSDQEIPYDEEHPDTPTWSRVIYVKAKDAFIGGNAVPTNGEGSQVAVPTTEGQLIKSFPQPTVNVKVTLAVEDDQITIFRGETVPGTTLPTSLAADPFCGMPATGTLSYQWVDASGNVMGFTDTNFPNDTGLKPSADTAYTLTVTFEPTPSNAGDASSTLGGQIYNAGNSNQNTLSDEGVYRIHVLTGTLTITKNLVGTTPVDTTTPFVFRIDRFENGVLAETFYRTIFTDGNRTGSITITGLSRGSYQITEQTDWSWRYEAADGQTVKKGTLGMQSGYTDVTLNVGFQNQKENTQWIGFTDSVTNLFGN